VTAEVSDQDGAAPAPGQLVTVRNRMWVWPAARRPAVGASRAALHAKLVAADGRVALIGSANLTDKALAVNLELGVIIRDPDIVGGIVRHFRVLMEPSSGTLEPLPA
jgi:putative cardiolipin synthase